MLIWISLVSIVTSPFSFLNLLIWVLFFMGLAKVLSWLSLCSEAVSCFTDVFLSLFHLFLLWLFKLFPFLLTSCIICSFSSCSLCKFRLFNWEFTFSLRYIQFSWVQSLSRVWLFVTPWIEGRQTSLSISNSQSLCKLRSNESVMPSNHLILCHPLLLQPSNCPSIWVFSIVSVLLIRWPKY